MSFLLKQFQFTCWAVFCGINFAHADGYESIPATYCAAIETHSEAEDDLITAKFDEFATEFELKFDSAVTVTRTYKDSSDSTLIVLNLGMGKFGAVVTMFYRVDEQAQASLLEALEKFINSDIASLYKVRLCEDIEGFKQPRLFGW